MGIAIGALALSVAEGIHGTPTGLANSEDFRLAFWLLAGLALLAVFDSLLLPADAGSRVLVARK
ncbi:MULTISPECIES: hypothetical protein [Burkholderia]|uniref:hypothetical protein n=1 Tax=Burkholderia TaxID=32008 RepID=UPI00064F9DC7|nr:MULTISPECIES: hypothetical protein [Burkholderia]KML15960.1 hypothetical protein VL00_13770 [Burkholderia cepacia]KML42217.1 hypothetical protein VL13_11095 [Burkholderia lata]KMN62263.1 hypothetical protein VK92_02875 [Burkholderia sp. LK4]